VSRVHFVSETAQVELKGGRVYAPAEQHDALDQRGDVPPPAGILAH